MYPPGNYLLSSAVRGICVARVIRVDILTVAFEQLYSPFVNLFAYPQLTLLTPSAYYLRPVSRRNSWKQKDSNLQPFCICNLQTALPFELHFQMWLVF